jgi:hypothetical protein
VRAPTGSELLVIVDEGDNAPLPITSARALLPAYRLRLFRAADARLRVAYGRTDLSRPHYDLALLAAQLLGSPATDAALTRNNRRVSLQRPWRLCRRGFLGCDDGRGHRVDRPDRSPAEARRRHTLVLAIILLFSTNN